MKRKPKAKRLVLSKLRKRERFKVVTPYQAGSVSLTMEGVYQIATAKADHTECAHSRPSLARLIHSNIFAYGTPLTISASVAKTIEVFKIPN
jgi:hypothetical protein